MAKGSISLRLIESDNTIKKHILASIVDDINKRIKKNKKKVITLLGNSVKSWVYEQPEIESLLKSGAPESLNAQFGIPTGRAAGVVHAIVDSIVKSGVFKIGKISDKLRGEVSFNFQSKDLMNVLSLPGGHVTTSKGTDLHWLDWLLTKGDTTIILGYSYVAGPLGRSGGGEMNIGGMWRVPPEFSGTQSDNFISRAFLGREKETNEILKRLLQ